MLVTRIPRDSRIAAREAAAIPFPRLETTPPVTNTYLVISAKLSVKAGVYRKPAKPTNCSALRELGPAAEMLQRLRIGQRLEIFRLSAMDNVAHRQFDDFAALRSEEHTLNSSHSQISYAVFCLKKKK